MRSISVISASIALSLLASHATSAPIKFDAEGHASVRLKDVFLAGTQVDAWDRISLYFFDEQSYRDGWSFRDPENLTNENVFYSYDNPDESFDSDDPYRNYHSSFVAGKAVRRLPNVGAYAAGYYDIDVGSDDDCYSQASCVNGTALDLTYEYELKASALVSGVGPQGTADASADASFFVFVEDYETGDSTSAVRDFVSVEADGSPLSEQSEAASGTFSLRLEPWQFHSVGVSSGAYGDAELTTVTPVPLPSSLPLVAGAILAFAFPAARRRLKSHPSV